MGQKTIMIPVFAALFFFMFAACNRQTGSKTSQLSSEDSLMNVKIKEFVSVKLTTDLTKLSEKEKQMIPLLIDAAKIMDDLYWMQVIGEKRKFLDSIPDSLTRAFAVINYGPWERLNGNKSFISGYMEKPAGANLYPGDMTKEEFAKWDNKDKTSQYSIIGRNEDHSLKNIWYHEAFRDKLDKASELLKKAAILAEDPGLGKYLELRATALVTDDYFASDMAWMDMKNNTIDFVVGPIENYEDELFGYKTAFESALLVKDKDWSLKLAKFAKFLPELQAQLPVDDKYKKEKPGTDSDLNAYDIIYVSGHSNAGSKTIAINLPNDEKVQMAKGSRRLQLKNAMRAKFDNILVPIANVLIDSTQKQNIKFDAFFSNVMFHEVAHGLGIKKTITGKGTVREALKEKYSSFEEAKADILGLFMTTQLIAKGEVKDISADDCFATFMAGLIRSVRFGAASAHGKANMMCFNFFADNDAFERGSNGTYKVNIDKMRLAMNKWSAIVLKFEGDGDYDGAKAYLETNGKIRETLQSDLERLKTANIPLDIIYEQGVNALGLTR
ncbi:MAG: Zn-dependent hydrolase [Bacteroidetes bacterium]|nr:Zn-dependent hydrolase [Bacteroidota bacterium]